MSEQSDSLISQLENFGLSPDESMVYIEVLKNPSISALKISRNLKIARTKVYRNIEKLLSKSLIKEKIEGYGKRFVAEQPEKFLQVLNNKEREVSLMRISAPTIINQLNSLQNIKKEESKILYHHGSEGLKQVNWNSTKAKGKIRIFELGQNMTEFISYDDSEEIRLELAKNKIEVNQLTNFKEIEEFTNISEHVKFWEPRYLNPEEFKISFEILIYDNVYTIYTFDQRDIFCVEIYNKTLAQMQKQIFDYFWNNATSMKKIGKNGRAELSP